MTSLLPLFIIAHIISHAVKFVFETFLSFQFDCDGRPYLDIYDIVCDGGNITDVKPIIGTLLVHHDL
jgi:hypothetical protein